MLKALIFDWHGVLDKITFKGMVNHLANLKQNSPENVKSLIQSYGDEYVRGSDPEEF